MIPHLGKAKGQRPPQYRLDLDLPPIERWKEMGKAFKIPLLKTLVVVDQIINQLPGHLKKFFLAIDIWSQTAFQYKEMAQEIKGISDVTNIPFSKIFFLNVIYEFTKIKSCTSIIVRNETGDILHGRNMDFEFFASFSNLAADVSVYKGGQYLYRMDAYVGGVFVHTASKPGAFSLTIDARHNIEDTSIEVLKNLVEKNYIPSAWLTRKVLDEETTWEGAVKRLNNTNITAAIYYIVAGVGKNEGAVIARKSGQGTHEIRTLSDNTWYLVQTNYDTDQKEPVYDQRRVPATKRVEEIGQKITIDDLYQKVMTLWPTFNVATIITFSAIPGRNYHNVTAWYGVNNITSSYSNEQKAIQIE